MGALPTAEEIAALSADHAALKALFQQHQEALVGLLFVHALADLEEFGRRLRRHIRVEEASLIPAYAGLDGLPRAGRPEFFLDEHRRIEQEFESLLDSMRSLSPGPRAGRAVVALLERELRFKQLLGHHEEREETALFPRLRAELNGKA